MIVVNAEKAQGTSDDPTVHGELGISDDVSHKIGGYINRSILRLSVKMCTEQKKKGLSPFLQSELH